MSDTVGLSTDRRVRRFRSISEKLQIVQLTQRPGASVAQVAQAHGVNANQVFKWRRAFDRGELVQGNHDDHQTPRKFCAGRGREISNCSRN